MEGAAVKTSPPGAVKAKPQDLRECADGLMDGWMNGALTPPTRFAPVFMIAWGVDKSMKMWTALPCVAFPLLQNKQQANPSRGP